MESKKVKEEPVARKEKHDKEKTRSYFAAPVTAPDEQQLGPETDVLLTAFPFV
jgi:hypothetical protein